jgi:hypothetical protein
MVARSQFGAESWYSADIRFRFDDGTETEITQRGNAFSCLTATPEASSQSPQISQFGARQGCRRR